MTTTPAPAILCRAVGAELAGAALAIKVAASAVSFTYRHGRLSRCNPAPLPTMEDHRPNIVLSNLGAAEGVLAATVSLRTADVLAGLVSDAVAAWQTEMFGDSPDCPMCPERGCDHPVWDLLHVGCGEAFADPDGPDCDADWRCRCFDHALRIARSGYANPGLAGTIRDALAASGIASGFYASLDGDVVATALGILVANRLVAGNRSWSGVDAVVTDVADFVAAGDEIAGIRYRTTPPHEIAAVVRAIDAALAAAGQPPLTTPTARDEWLRGDRG